MEVPPFSLQRARFIHLLDGFIFHTNRLYDTAHFIQYTHFSILLYVLHMIEARQRPCTHLYSLHSFVRNLKERKHNEEEPAYSLVSATAAWRCFCWVSSVYVYNIESLFIYDEKCMFFGFCSNFCLTSGDIWG